VTGPQPLGPLIHSFFLDHLITVKGLRPASVRSYRDTIRLLLCFVADDKKTKITKLSASDLTFERILGFLRYLEGDRHNHARTRNQRLAALHTLFDYIASRDPEMLGICQQVTAIPMKRAAPAETHFLERDEIQALFRHLPRAGRLALRDRALLLFLYNTGARVQEVADLRAGHLELGEHPLERRSSSAGRGFLLGRLTAVECAIPCSWRVVKRTRTARRGSRRCRLPGWRWRRSCRPTRGCLMMR